MHGFSENDRIFNKNMANLIKIKRGLDIEISGKAQETIGSAMPSKVIAMIPDHYHGIVPKIVVKPGDKVKAGTPVFHNKANAGMNFVSPVSGEIIAVNRGERRKVLSITIAREDNIEYEKFDMQSLGLLSGEEVKALLLQSGLWAYIKQRPFDVIANPDIAPKAIFISSFDSAPLAPNNDFAMKGEFQNFQTGIDALAKLTSGKIHLGIKAGSKSNDFRMVRGVQITEFQGPHPAGNISVQINHLDPINKGETVWTIGAQDVVFLGRFFNKGIVDLSRLVALTGPEVVENENQYYRTLPGASIEPIVRGNVQTGIPLRYISGNVLTGLKVEADGYIDPYATQITILDEGSQTHELLGWAMPRFTRFSTKNVYFTKLIDNPIARIFIGKIRYDWDSRVMGGRRNIIMSGEYDSVFPMDILPEFLIKAMLAKNVDKMENLGALEVAPEDFALCEFVDTSKLPLQQICRDALDYLQKELA